MKKLFIALALLVSVQLVAQPKEAVDAQKVFDKAQKESMDAKKSALPATWIKLAGAYTTFYDIPVKSLWIGASNLEVKVVLKDQKVLSSETRNVQGQDYTVDVYEDKDLYYGADGKLAAIKVTKQYKDGDLLGGAYNAIVKAAELDTKAAKTKEITDILTSLKSRYQSEGMSSYTLGDFKNASNYFESVVNTGKNPLLKSVDTVFMYYTALTANMAKDYEKAVKYFEMAISNGYDAKGDAYSYLSDSYKQLKETEKSKEALIAGFKKYPTTQSILVSLINAYLESNDDPKKVLDLIEQAQKNEPKNASLHYAEGNVYKSLKDMEKAIACYNKAIEIDPNYYFGSFAIGAAYYDMAVEIQTKANEEADDTKYEAMVKQMEQNLMSAIKPFEACFATSTDKEVKAVVAEYLKNIYFRFRNTSDEYKAGYEKYNSYLQNK